MRADEMNDKMLPSVDKTLLSVEGTTRKFSWLLKWKTISSDYCNLVMTGSLHSKLLDSGLLS